MNFEHMCAEAMLGMSDRCLLHCCLSLLLLSWLLICESLVYVAARHGVWGLLDIVAEGLSSFEAAMG